MMKLRPVKYEFFAQRKEASETVEDYFPACIRDLLDRTLSLRRPAKLAKKITQAIQLKLK